jgi:glutamate/tyrosine decarboxylase-like PLP-dependent enzyme
MRSVTTHQPSFDHLSRVLELAATLSGEYAASIADRGVAPSPDALRALTGFDEPLPDGPGDAAATLQRLHDLGSPATMATSGPRYYGFVNGATYPVALGAAWLTATWDQNAALPVMSPAAARLHDVARDWLVELLGFPSGTEASFVTGATMANATALAAARDRQLERVGWDVQRRGLFGAPELNVVVGAKAHSTVFKALGMVGLGRERVHVVPADAQGRMRADQLPDVSGPTVVVAQAGEVNTGAFDPFEEIVGWARERDAWVHVDGAFGLWALADPSRAALVRGLTDADSWGTDGHKWLNVTYDCGIVFVRDPADLRRSFASVAGYLPPDDGYEAMHHTPQSSQRARQVEVWAVLRTLGRSGVASLVSSRCDLAQRLAAGLSAGGLEIVNDVVLNQVLVRATGPTPAEAAVLSGSCRASAQAR